MTSEEIKDLLLAEYNASALDPGHLPSIALRSAAVRDQLDFAVGLMGHELSKAEFVRLGGGQVMIYNEFNIKRLELLKESSLEDAMALMDGWMSGLS